MRTGDTLCLMLDYQINGEDLVENGYDEIELQLNKEGNSKALKKLLSRGEIIWDTVVSNDEEFTGYVVYLTQKETFSLGTNVTAQIRVKIGDEVGSSEQSEFDLDTVLSSTIL